LKAQTVCLSLSDFSQGLLCFAIIELVQVQWPYYSYTAMSSNALGIKCIGYWIIIVWCHARWCVLTLLHFWVVIFQSAVNQTADLGNHERLRADCKNATQNSTQLSATQDLSLHSTSFHCKKILCCQVESTYWKSQPKLPVKSKLRIIQ